MGYKLIKSNVFERRARKLLKLHPELIPVFKQVLELLSKDPFTQTLKSHILKGKLSGNYACSVNYEIRIVFRILNDYQTEFGSYNVLFLETIGTHDEVY